MIADREFMQNITALYAPPEPIVFFLACGGMSSKYCNDTQAAVASMNLAGHSNVHYLDLTPSSVGVESKYMGCAGHPSWIGHAKAAAIAEPIVKSALGW